MMYRKFQKFQSRFAQQWKTNLSDDWLWYLILREKIEKKKINKTPDYKVSVNLIYQDISRPAPGYCAHLFFRDSNCSQFESAMLT